MTNAQMSLLDNQTGDELEIPENLVLHIEGASPEETKRGLDAAQAVFDRAGITAQKALWATWTIESNDDVGLPEQIPEEALEHMHVWDNAEQAAIAACCAGWQSGKPQNYVLHLFPDREAVVS